jgi:hypothetical protein
MTLIFADRAIKIISRLIKPAAEPAESLSFMKVSMDTSLRSQSVTFKFNMHNKLSPSAFSS